MTAAAFESAGRPDERPPPWDGQIPRARSEGNILVIYRCRRLSVVLPRFLGGLHRSRLALRARRRGWRRCLPWGRLRRCQLLQLLAEQRVQALGALLIELLDAERSAAAAQAPLLLFLAFIGLVGAKELALLAGQVDESLLVWVQVLEAGTGQIHAQGLQIFQEKVHRLFGDVAEHRPLELLAVNQGAFRVGHVDLSSDDEMDTKLRGLLLLADPQGLTDDFSPIAPDRIIGFHAVAPLFEVCRPALMAAAMFDQA